MLTAGKAYHARPSKTAASRAAIIASDGPPPDVRATSRTPRAPAGAPTRPRAAVTGAGPVDGGVMGGIAPPPPTGPWTTLRVAHTADSPASTDPGVSFLVFGTRKRVVEHGRSEHGRSEHGHREHSRRKHHRGEHHRREHHRTQLVRSGARQRHVGPGVSNGSIRPKDCPCPRPTVLVLPLLDPRHDSPPRAT